MILKEGAMYYVYDDVFPEIFDRTYFESLKYMKYVSHTVRMDEGITYYFSDMQEPEYIVRVNQFNHRGIVFNTSDAFLIYSVNYVKIHNLVNGSYFKEKIDESMHRMPELWI